jgi:starch phosphorylase
VLNLSIADGWWCEGYNGGNGWTINSTDSSVEEGRRDVIEAASLYQLLENEIVPLYYQRDSDGIPRGWIRVVKEAIGSITPLFSARRMVKEYVERFYVPAAQEATVVPTTSAGTQP